MRARFVGATFRDAQWRELVHEEDGPVMRDLDRRADRVQAAARQLVGVQTGRLLATIRKQRHPGLPAVDVVAGREGLTPYLGWHHDGTAPHIIRPRRRQALRFITGGRVVFARSVAHPGTTDTRFLTRALNAAAD